MRLFTVLRSRGPAWNASVIAAGLLASTSDAFSQEEPRHLNPVIEKPAAGEPFIGVSTGDLSLSNANELTRAPIDYVYVDMEHNPFSFESLYMFNLGTLVCGNDDTREPDEDPA